MEQQKATRWRWTKRRVRAAVLVAEGEKTTSEIATEVGIGRPQLWRWCQRVEFKERVEALVKKMETAAERYAIGGKAARLRAMDERWQALNRVISERAAAPETEGVPGAKTGLLFRTIKGIGRGEDFRVVEEWAVDVGLLREMSALESAAAVETGQLLAKVAPVTPDGEGAYEAGGFTEDEVTAILSGLATRLGLTPAGEVPREHPGL